MRGLFSLVHKQELSTIHSSSVFPTCLAQGSYLESLTAAILSITDQLAAVAIALAHLLSSQKTWINLASSNLAAVALISINRRLSLWLLILQFLGAALVNIIQSPTIWMWKPKPLAFFNPRRQPLNFGNFIHCRKTTNQEFGKVSLELRFKSMS